MIPPQNVDPRKWQRLDKPIPTDAPYDPVTGRNSGDLGFTSLTGQNQYGDPNVQLQVPFQGGFLDILQGYDPNTNPYAFRYDPSQLQLNKVVYGSQNLGGPIGQATQTINGQTFNVNGNNFLAGQSSATPTQFQTSQPSAPPSQTTPAPFTEFMFGNNGSLGTLKGSFGQGSFYQAQPSSTTQSTPGLGTLSPWNPSLDALKKARSIPQ